MAICQCFSPEDRNKLHRYTRLSAREKLEYGAPLREPCQVGEIVKGQYGKVAIPRPASSIGTFHTHMAAEDVRPSPSDLSESLYHADKSFCIGSRDEVTCFSPSKPEKVETLSVLVRMLRGDVEEFSQQLMTRHGKLRMEGIEEMSRGLELRRRANRIAELQKDYQDYLEECKL